MVYVFMTTFHVYNVFVANVQSGEKWLFEIDQMGAFFKAKPVQIIEIPSNYKRLTQKTVCA